MKGWIERVFTPGITYKMGKVGIKPLLSDKTSFLITSSNAPNFYTKLNPHYPVKRLKRDILAGCGIKVTKSLVYGRSGFASDTAERREKYREKVLQLV